MFEKQLHQALLRVAGSFLSFDEVEDGNNNSDEEKKKKKY